MNEVDVFLAHYGVKGMKWGKRKAKSTEPTKKSLSEGQKKALKIVAVSGAVTLTAATTVIAIKAGRKHFAGINLDAKTVLQNINTYGDDLHINKPLYVTHLPKDRKVYATKFVEEVMGRLDRGKDTYATLFEGRENIKAPSRHETKKLYSAWRESVGRPVAKGRLDRELNNFFRTTALSSGPKPPESFTEFVKRQGYNALQDTLDSSNSHLKAKSPLLILNGQESLILKGSQFVEDLLKTL